jgi:heme-degrading monooxygenase HmoA
MTVRVMVFATVRDGDATAFEEAYSEVSAKVLGTPGHLRDELLHQVDTPNTYILLSEWQSEEQFRAWEDAPVHREITVPMRPYWSGQIERRIYETTAPGRG